MRVPAGGMPVPYTVSTYFLDFKTVNRGLFLNPYADPVLKYVNILGCGVGEFTFFDVNR